MSSLPGIPLDDFQGRPGCNCICSEIMDGYVVSVQLPVGKLCQFQRTRPASTPRRLFCPWGAMRRCESTFRNHQGQYMKQILLALLSLIVQLTPIAATAQLSA